MKYSLRLFIFILLLTFIACHKTGDEINGLAFKEQANGGWGLLATDGTVLVPANTFDQQPSTVVNGLFSLPDDKGFSQLYRADCPTHPVNPRHFARIGHFFENVTLAQETLEAPILIIDREGKDRTSINTYPQYNIVLAHNFSEGRALVCTSEGKYGYIDTQGKMIIPPVYDEAHDFNDGVALVGISNTNSQMGYQVIDPQGNVRFAIQLHNSLLDHRFSNQLLMYKSLDTGFCGYLDKEGLPLIYLPKNIRDSYQFSHGMTTFQTNSGTGVIDARGEILIPANYEEAFIAGKRRICLKANGQWAIATPSEQLLCRFIYHQIGLFYSSGLAIAQQQGAYMLINPEGKPQSAKRYALIVEEATATRKATQVFVRRDATITSPKSNRHLDEVLLANEPNATVIKDTALKGSQTTQSVIQNYNWKEVSKQSPFYAEASKIVAGKLTDTDAKSRQMILNYVEHLRASYTSKDIDFLKQLFSEHALIVVGTVIRTTPQKETRYLAPAQIVYNVKSKQTYLERLKQVFKANKNIQVTFSDFRIMRHPTIPGLYGVSLRQGYTSDLYADDGYLFLLWDFRDETAPRIHVRTWQPSMLDEQTPLPEESIFQISNFNLQ